MIVVPFPFVDIPAAKRRPSLILSNRIFNEANGHSICAMVTTAVRTRWLSDVAISDLGSAGLPRACVVRWKLFTLPNHLIERKAGMLGRVDRAAVTSTARVVLP
ncbi:MAG: type II toxin-antitoxin system PemK/MazF family toxin [Alphaproteobacteria bacterium]